MLKGIPFDYNTTHLKCEISHIPGDQYKYSAKKSVVSLISFFVRNQKDTNKKKLEGDKKRKKRNKTYIHLLKVHCYILSYIIFFHFIPGLIVADC